MGKRKQPFGYKMKLGEIVPQPQEAETDQEKKKNLRVAAYCRVSTKKGRAAQQLRKPESILHGKNHGKSRLDDGGYFRG